MLFALVEFIMTKLLFQNKNRKKITHFLKRYFPLHFRTLRRNESIVKTYVQAQIRIRVRFGTSRTNPVVHDHILLLSKA